MNRLSTRVTQPETDEYRYWAFISYSRNYEKWAQSLHYQLEHYRIPRSIRTDLLAGASAPPSLRPIFRDADELPASADLGGRLREALDRSRYLIVLASPTAAASRWVNAEIQHFVESNREKNIFVVVVDGEPGGAPQLEPMPAALTQGTEGAWDGAWINARRSTKPHPRVLAGLVAGMLDVGFDALWQRDRRRRRRQFTTRGAVALLLVALVVGGGIWQQQRLKFALTGVRCVPGNLVIDGSALFAPLVTDIVKSYVRSCPGANINIVVDAKGSSGIHDLTTDGLASPDIRSSRIVVSDVPAAAWSPSLTVRPLAFIVFVIVVNRATGVHELTQEQIRDIYIGAVTNWNQLGGSDLPISIVSRGADSGTRRSFEKRVLLYGELAISSDNCVDKDRAPASTVVRCERSDTGFLLEEVNRIPGAIGYADKPTTLEVETRLPDVRRVLLDGWQAENETVMQHLYKLFTVVYIYTYGAPNYETLASAFLDYMNSDTVTNILRRHDYVPCLDEPGALALCR